MTRLLLLVALLLSPRWAQAEQDPCARIVSLAPSITEVVFELGLGHKLVGVTRFCRYPPQAQSIAQVGGFYDVSLENLLALKPSYVFGLRENAEIREAATRFGVPSTEVDHSTVEGIKASIASIAKVCGVEEQGQQRLSDLEKREKELSLRMAGVKPYRTLVVVGRTHEGDSLSGIYVSGKDGFYSGVLRLLGLKNVNSEGTVAMPMLSPEGLMALAPEVIVEVINVDDQQSKGAREELWRRYPNLPAVKNDRLILLTQDFASIPGPRYIMVAEEIAQRLAPHKEAR